MDTTFIKYITTLKVDYSVTPYSVILLHQLPYAFYYVDQSNLKNHNNLLNLREKVKQNHQKLLVFIWWDLWQYKTDVVKSKIKHIIGQSTKIHARKTTVKPINRNKAIDFQQKNHLSVALPGFKRYGLFLNDDLIALAVFAKKRKFNDGSYSAELLRFSTKNNLHINGGLSKLIKPYLNTYHIDSLMTYVDLDWADGSKFKKIGFKIINNQPPMFFKLENNSRQLSSPQKYDVFNMGSLKLLLNNV